jgi:predicted HNH restriction endonuclease
MYMKDSDLATIDRILRDLGCALINKDRVSDDWKAKIYRKGDTGRQVGIYDRKVGFVLRLEELTPELEKPAVVKCAKGGVWNHDKSHFKNGKGFCVKLPDLTSVEHCLKIYFFENTRNSILGAAIEEMQPSNETPERKKTEVDRIVRNTEITKKIKQLYNFQCQVCGVAIKTKDGLYAEGAHIRGLGEPHNGPDIEANVLCLCPNHHAMFDKGGFYVNNDFSLISIDGRLQVDPRHNIGMDFIEYHRKNTVVDTHILTYI